MSASDAGPFDEIVVVRARNRVENQQDVPISISVVRGEELENLQANEINALTMRAANVSWNQGNQRTSSLSIRGIGKQGQTEAQDPSVGVIVDGVNYAYNALTSSFDFTDVDVVEVVRGPQGTLDDDSSLASGRQLAAAPRRASPPACEAPERPCSPSIARGTRDRARRVP